MKDKKLIFIITLIILLIGLTTISATDTNTEITQEKQNIEKNNNPETTKTNINADNKPYYTIDDEIEENNNAQDEDDGIDYENEDKTDYTPYPEDEDNIENINCDEIEKNEIEYMENTNDTEFLKDSSSNLEENKKTIKTTTYNTNTISTDNTKKYNKNTLQPSKNNELKKINNNFIKSSQKLFETDNTNEENNIAIIENDKTRKKNIFTKILDMLMMIATYLHLPPIEQ